MKFLCDQCHAKYQIADDKIAGKTLRMKCRRCGHDIELRGGLESSDHHVAAERSRTTTGSSVLPPSALSGEVRSDSVYPPRPTTGSHDAPPRPRTSSGAQDVRARTSSDVHEAAARARTSSGSHDAGVRARTTSGSHEGAARARTSSASHEAPRERVPTGAPRPPPGRPQTGSFGAREPTGPATREPTGAGWKSDPLGAGFQRSLQEGRSLDGERKSAPPPGDDWYVAIQDVPVGPVSKEEIAKRIRAGDVRGGSLCWREGFDDWRPLEEVAELAPLLRREREPTGRVPPPVPAGGRPPTGSFATASRGAGPASGSLGLRPPTGRFATASRPAASSSGDSARARVETPPPVESGPRGKVVPIGGRLGGAAAPRIEPSIESPTVAEPSVPSEPQPTVREPSVGFATSARAEPMLPSGSAAMPVARGPAPEPQPPPAGTAVAFASIPPGSSVSVSAPSSSILVPPQSVPVQVQVQSRGMPTGAWIAIVGAAAFGIALAIVVGIRLTAPAPAPVAVAPAPTREAVRQPEPERAPDPPPPPTAPPPTQEAAVDVPPEAEVAAAAEQEGNGEGTSGGSRRSGDGASSSRGSSATTTTGAAAAPPGTTAGSRTKSRALTDEQRAALAAASGGSDVAGATTSSLRVQDRVLGSGGGGGSSAPLTDEAVAAAVSRNRPSLRACYERSVRGVSQDAMTRFRVAFAISIGASGAVTRVSVSGAPSALPGLADCFERTIRRWRFPASGGSSRTEFTALFQPGG
ncbi:MAG: zinc-ribbon domain-containing protein [Deltaproteobacteria bacterium]|nr:zinc-ribbon domain-containing protein [Deltaproteobacteria bacterium]